VALTGPVEAPLAYCRRPLVTVTAREGLRWAGDAKLPALMLVGPVYVLIVVMKTTPPPLGGHAPMPEITPFMLMTLPLAEPSVSVKAPGRRCRNGETITAARNRAGDRLRAVSVMGS
jgi:hypothetical protein